MRSLLEPSSEFKPGSFEFGSLTAQRLSPIPVGQFRPSVLTSAPRAAAPGAPHRLSPTLRPRHGHDRGSRLASVDRLSPENLILSAPSVRGPYLHPHATAGAASESHPSKAAPLRRLRAARFLQRYRTSCILLFSSCCDLRGRPVLYSFILFPACQAEYSC